MIPQLLRILNVEQGEEKQVFFLFLQSLCFGVYFATYEVASTTLFMSGFGGEMLSRAIMISGGVGVILSSLYGRFQSKISFTNFSFFNLIAICIFTFCLRLGFDLFDYQVTVFISFIMWGPLFALSMLGFWGVAGRMFSLRQGKRLFSMIDSGLIFGIIIINFVTPIIRSLLPKVEDVFDISLAAIIMAAILQVYINKKFAKRVAVKARTELKKVSVNTLKFKDLFKDRYILNLALYVFFSVLVSFFVYCDFLDVTKAQYPKEDDFLNFIALFIATVMVFTFLIKTFLFSRLTSMYGLLVSLLLVPVIVGLFSLSSIFSGISLGSLVSEPYFIVYFLMVALSRLFSHSLTMSIEKPILKVLYQPIDENVRYDVMAKIDGTLNELAGVVAGLILLAISVLPFYHQFIVNYFIVAGLVIITILIFRLYRQYQKKLRSSLDKMSSDVIEEDDLDRSPVLKALKSVFPWKKIHAMKLAEKIEPILLDDKLEELVNDPSPEVRQNAIEQIVQLKIFNGAQILSSRLENEDSEEIRVQLSDAIEELYSSDEQAITYEYLEMLINSKLPENRKRAAQLIAQVQTEESVALLLELIRDIEPPVRLAAIKTAAKLNRQEFWPFLTDNLSSIYYKRAAMSALIAIGEDVLDNLESSFYRSTSTSTELIQIIRIMAIIGGEKSISLLLKKLTYPDSRIVKEVLSALKKCGYKATSDHFPKIFHALENTISIIAWNIAAISELEGNIELERALKEENELNHEMLFLLLSLMYDARSIEKVKDNIQNGSTESLGYALELLDIFVSEEIKTLLFPLFDDKPISEKLRQLQVYFPRAKYNKVEVLIHIMNRDYNTLTRWTKACAVEAYGDLENPELNYDLISNLFNPDRLIRETAARVIFEISPEKYHEVGRRIPSKVKWELDKLVANKDGLFRYQSDRFKFLSDLPYFKSLNNDMMVKLVKEFDLRILKQGMSTITNSARTNYVLNIVCSGQVLTNEKGADEVLGAGRIFGPFFTLSRNNSIESKTLSETVLLSLSEEKFYELMYNYREFIEIFVELIDDKSFLEETEIVE